MSPCISAQAITDATSTVFFNVARDGSNWITNPDWDFKWKISEVPTAALSESLPFYFNLTWSPSQQFVLQSIKTSYMFFIVKTAYQQEPLVNKE